MNTQSIDLSWLAGVIEGEGSISLFKHTEKNGAVKICPTLSITNTDVVLINEVHKILNSLGCNFHLQEKIPNNLSKKVCYNFISRNMKYIQTVLSAIIPFMRGAKKAEAELVLGYVVRRTEKMIRMPSKGSTPYGPEDHQDYENFRKLRSPTTTREELSS